MIQPNLPPKSRKQTLHVTLPEEAEVKPSPAKKRKVDQAETEAYSDPEIGHISIGGSLIGDFAKDKKKKRLRHKYFDLARSGVGQIHEAFKMLVASAYAHDKESEKVESDHQALKDNNANLKHTLKEKDELTAYETFMEG